MKKIIYFLFLCSSICIAQTKYITKTGIVKFEASVPSFEEVKANNKTVTAILNTENGEFAALALIKGFRFKNALMEEHFNENYAESEKYPKATFKGKLYNFDHSNIQNNYTLIGELYFHGVKKIMEEILVSMNKKENVITFSGFFSAKASDFDIKIPKIVRNKIAENIKVVFEFELKEK